MKTGITVGHDSKALKEMGNVILSILRTKEDQATKQIALDTLKNMAQINSTTISGCSFNG